MNSAADGPSGNGRDTDATRTREEVVGALAIAMETVPIGLVLIELRIESETGNTIEADDETRAELGSRIARCLTDSDELLTPNVDRFLIIKRQLTAPAETEGFALRLLNALGGPLHGGPAKGICHSTIGVAVSHAKDDAEDLLRYAEHALADAHLLGGDLVVCFEDADRELLPER